MVCDPSRSPAATVLKRLIAVALVLSLLLSGPGYSELWAAVVDDVPVAVQAGLNVNPLAGPQAPQSPLGGPSLNGVPAGWAQLPSGLIVPAAAVPGLPAAAASAAGVPSSASQAPVPAADSGLESSADAEQAPASVLSSEGRAAVNDAVQDLSPDKLGSMSGEQARQDGAALETILEGGAAKTGAESLPVSAVSRGITQPAVAPAPSAAVRALHSLSRVLPLPEVGSAQDTPKSLWARLYDAGIWARSFKHYFLDINIENWREYRERRKAALAGHDAQTAVTDAHGFVAALDGMDLAVPSDAQKFFIGTRFMGMVGGYQTVGSRSGSDAMVTAQAIEVFDTYFNNHGVTSQTRGAFLSFLGRASRFNPGRRSSNLRKQIRKAMQSASLLPPSALESFFDAQMPDVADANRAIVEYQKSEQGAVLAAFRQAVAQTIQEEPVGPGRVLAVVVLGSFANGAATPTSDFDLQVLSADGESSRVDSFLARLQSHWSPPGRTQPHPVNATPFAFAALRGLLLRIHREPYLVVSPDAELERALSPPAGYFDDFKRPDASTWGESLAREACLWVLKAALPLIDLKDRFSGPAASSSVQSLDENARAKARTGWLIARSLYLSGFVLSGLIAFPILAQEAVGKQGYTDLMSLGSLAAIGLASWSGALIDRLSYRDTFAINTLVRTVVAVAIPALIFTHTLSFWPMLAVSLVNGWNISSSLIAEDKLMPALAGSDPKKLTGINAASNISYIAINVALGIFLSAGHWVDVLMAHFGKMDGLSIVFLVNAATCVAGLVIQWFTIPNVRPNQAAKPAVVAAQTGGGNLLWGGVLAAGAALYFVLHGMAPQFATLPLVAAIFARLAATSEGFKSLWKNKVLRTDAVLGMLYAFVVYPAQSMLVPFLAKELNGGALLQGQLQGALFFGQLLAGSTMLSLPGRWNALVQGGVLAAIAAWIGLYLFPHSLIAAVAAMAMAVALRAAAARLTDRGWMRYAFTGLACIALPIAFWGNVPVLLLSIGMVGLFNAPNKITIDTVMQREAKESDPQNAGRILGVRGALVNIATAFGYASFGAVSQAFHPLFPGMLWPMAAAFAGVAVVFWLAPRWLGRRIAPKDFKPGLGRWLPWTKGGPILAAAVIGARRAFAATMAGFFGAAAFAAPGLSRQQLASVLAARLREKGIKAIVTDYDGTLMDKTPDDKAVPASEDLAALLKALRKEGIQVVISTNHFFTGDHNGMTELLGDRLDAETRAGMMFVVQSGARVYEYGAKGETPAEPVWKETPFDDAERAKITPAFEEAARAVGLEPADWKLVHEDSRTLIELHNHQDRLDALYKALADANTKNGWNYLVQVKPMPTMRNVPYIQYFKAHKGTGAKKAFDLLKARGQVAHEAELLVLGDDFKPEGNDLYMAQSLPGATAISVSKSADARQPNVFQSQIRGAAATHDVLRDLLALLSAPKP